MTAIPDRWDRKVKRTLVIAAVMILVAGITVVALVWADEEKSPQVWSCAAPPSQDLTMEQLEKAITTPVGRVPDAPVRWRSGQEGVIKFAGESFDSFCGFIGQLLAPAGLQNFTVMMAVGDTGQEVRQCVLGVYEIPRHPDWCMADPFTTQDGQIGYESAIILYSLEELRELAQLEEIYLQLLLLAYTVGLVQADIDPRSQDAGVFTSCVVGIWYGSQAYIGNASVYAMEEMAAKLPSPDAAILGMQHRQLSYCLF